MTAEALKIMTAPSRHSPSVTRNSHLSFSKRLGIAFLRVGCVLRIVLWPGFVAALQLANELFENAAAMFVLLKLIETCASWRQQNHVARLSSTRRDLDRALQSPRAFDSHATRDLTFDLLGYRSNQQSENRPFPQKFAQRRVVAGFVLPTKNHADPPPKYFYCF